MVKAAPNPAREKLLKKELVYLRSTISGPGMSAPAAMWAVDIDANYPWAGGWTYDRKDASAFTVAVAKQINDYLEKSKFAGYRYETEPAAADHEGAIYFIPGEER